VGIGYRATSKGRVATFTWATRNPIEVCCPWEWNLRIDKQTHLVLSSARPASAGPGGGEHSRAAAAGPLQEQGHPLHGRSAAEEGRQDGAAGNDPENCEKRDRAPVHDRSGTRSAGRRNAPAGGVSAA